MLVCLPDARKLVSSRRNNSATTLASTIRARIRAAIRRVMIEIPGWRDWCFAIKTFCAAIAALYLAFWFDLPRPYWALTTVYITSQVLSGATQSKALFRVLGTLLGATVSIILIPNLVNAPTLLCLAIALWVALCLYFSLLDRTPRSYVLMLAGYTLGIIGFPSVDAPGTIFDTAVSRVEEITLGILCASLVSIAVFPQSALPLISTRLDNWILNARAWVIDIFQRNSWAIDTQTERLKLASEAIALDSLATSLRYEMAGIKGSDQAMAVLRQHMLMFLPIASSISDRIQVLESIGALSERIRALLSDAAWWLRSDLTDRQLANDLRQRCEKLEPKLDASSTWAALLEASLLRRLRDFIDLRQDTRQLQHILSDRKAFTDKPAFSYTARARSIRHRDHGMALLSAVGVFLSILVTCVIWIETGWPDGSAAPMMAAVACCFFATFDDPVPYIVSFANSAILGAVFAGLYLFAVLPHATGFEMLILALAPWLIPCGLFMAQPRTAPFATGVVVNGGSMIAIQNGAIGDFTPFANSAIAIIIGMWVSAIIVQLVRSVGTAWSAHRLRRINRDTLADSAMHGGSNHGLELAALMLDRVGLIAPRLAALPPDDAGWTADLLAEVRSGINLVEIRRVRRDLPLAGREAIGDVLDAMAEYLRSDAQQGCQVQLSKIDRAIRVLLNEHQTEVVREAILGLVGLRRGLFPDSPAFKERSSTAEGPEASP